MVLRVSKSKAGGRVGIPPSKSHTIRALFFASLAGGISTIEELLISEDALSAMETCRALGAEVSLEGRSCTVRGHGGRPKVPDDVINVGNSGTTLRFGVAASALGTGWTVFTGDRQIRSRQLGPLLEALNNLGASAFSTRGNGLAPVVVKGRMKGGKTDLDSITSQYLSALLIHAPLLDGNTHIAVTRLNEVPYVDMTLWWLDRLGIRYENDNYGRFTLYGGQKYPAFNMRIPGDFSSATFLAVLAAVSGGEFVLENLDMSDPQGDKEVFRMLEKMGALVEYGEDYITVRGRGLEGQVLDLNSTPDALPAMAVAGCFAEGETRLVNVPQARIKETDRIHVMCTELAKMGAEIYELPDGLVIRRSRLKGCRLNGHHDHRVVMALALAGLNADGETAIDTAEAINVTFPDFVEILQRSGACIDMVKEV